MKRIKEACICQTLHFMLKEDVGHDYAVRVVQEEIKKYKESLDKNKTKYKIVEETEQPDGSVNMVEEEEAYFEKIDAPDKELFYIEGGHVAPLLKTNDLSEYVHKIAEKQKNS